MRVFAAGLLQGLFLNQLNQLDTSFVWSGAMERIWHRPRSHFGVWPVHTRVHAHANTHIHTRHQVRVYGSVLAEELALCVCAES